MIINSTTLRNMYVAFSAAFKSGIPNAKPEYEKFTMTTTSTTKSNEYGWLGATSRFREWIGDRVLQSLKSHGYTIKNKKFENTVEVDRDDIEDDNLGIYTVPFQQLGKDAADHPGELVYTLFNSAFTTECYDGQYFFDTDHPVLNADGTESSVSNFGGGSGPAWYLFDTTQIIKPFILQKRRDYKFKALDNETDQNVFMRDVYIYGVDARLNVGFGLWQLAYASKQPLTEANLNAAFDAMRAFKGDNGRPLNIKPSLLVVPTTLRQTAKKLLENENNDAGASNSTRNLVEFMDTAYLN
jgi:phage major head subunit gpT-like protein